MVNEISIVRRGCDNGVNDNPGNMGKADPRRIRIRIRSK